MIPIFRKSSIDVDEANPVYQETKTTTQMIQDFMNGDGVLDQQLEPSKDFPSEDDVDFEADLVASHHDIYDVASGQDKVFADSPVVTDVPFSETAVSVETNQSE